MGEGDMNALVVYATKSGCTAGIAEKIGETLVAHGATVDLKSAKEAGAPEGYDAVIVGSGVRAGSWHAAARDWVTSHADVLRTLPVAFFTCGLSPTDPTKTEETRGYTDSLIDATGVEPIDIGLFAGWNEPTKFSFLERTVLKALKSPVGDFRDFDAVATWADDVSRELSVG
jgi:menaquinone-dependent protoporphyrinogen oxidase